ncbi:ComEA family DNA-binding protein [Candidatus Dojkabacteria bacterium]|nr:ComEA family DNA-binding protein [Candidatus Dojkabacteria bacterium]
MSRKLGIITVGVVVLIAAGVFVFWQKGTKREQVLLQEFKSEPEAQENPSIEGNNIPEEVLNIYISGAVGSPGVYELPAHSLLIDAVNAAGGFDQSADLGYIQRCINMAAQLIPNEMYYVPFLVDNLSCVEKSNISSAVSDANTNAGTSGKISINHATRDQLISLPGVGPATADKIIAGRPYAVVGDLLNVSGIGEKTLQAIIDLIEP